MIIGIILFIIALVLNNMQVLRILLSITSLILLTYSFVVDRVKKKMFSVLYFIMLLLFSISVDYLVVGAFKKVPIYSYSVANKDNNTLYNAFGYRVWKCSNGNFKVDNLYKLGYYCDNNEISEESINNIINNIYDNFDKYKDTYIKVSGKVSDIKDSQTIIMQGYKEDISDLIFVGSNKLYVVFNMPSNKISNLSSGDDVVISGKVDRIEGNNIYLIDASFNDNISPKDEITFDVDDKNFCQYDRELWFETSDNLFYKSCIDDVEITIGNKAYNIVNALTTNTFTLDDLEQEAKGYLTNNKDNSIIYNYDNFKILVCDPNTSRDIIIGSSKLGFGDGYCEIDSEEGAGLDEV